VPEDVDSEVGAERTRLLQEGKPVGERDDVWPSQQRRIESMVIALEPQTAGQLDQGAQRCQMLRAFFTCHGKSSATHLLVPSATTAGR
jgi:hypothetical protein